MEKKLFYSGTEVVKSIKDIVGEYKYECDKVTNEDLKNPDLSNYTVENKTQNLEDMIQKIVNKALLGENNKIQLTFKLLSCNFLFINLSKSIDI